MAATAARDDGNFASDRGIAAGDKVWINVDVEFWVSNGNTGQLFTYDIGYAID